MRNSHLKDIRSGMSTSLYKLQPASHGSHFFFFFNDPATTEIYPLSLHDALPIRPARPTKSYGSPETTTRSARLPGSDRKSTRLNSSHDQISYAVFCLKKKKK